MSFFHEARTASCTLLGSGMYSRPDASAAPLVKAQSKNLITLWLRAASFGSCGSRMKVAETIGQLAACRSRVTDHSVCTSID